MAKKKRNTRVDRWESAAAKAGEGLAELAELQEDYAEWQANLPPGLENSAVGEKLAAIAELPIGEAADLLDQIAMADLPMGFGAALCDRMARFPK